MIGDFNAVVGGDFFNEWTDTCTEKSMSFADVEYLNPDSYTHINNATLTRSWLDHCLVTRSVWNSITDIRILYDYYQSDHIPLCVKRNFDHLPRHNEQAESVPKIKWDFVNDFRF